MAGGLFVGASWGIGEARALLGSEAQAASLTVADEAWTGPLAVDAPAAIEARAAEVDRRPAFFGVPDETLLAPLRGAEMVKAKFNRGGSSVSLRVDFDNGARAAFKPDQTNAQTVPRYEVAAYRIDRLLGIGAVPPAMAVRFRMEDLLDRIGRGNTISLARMRTEVVQDDGGWVNGELSWWIPEIEHARIAGIPIDKTDGIVTWKRLLTAGKEIAEEDREMAAQISTMVLFDHLINNSDRFTGNNTRSSPDNRKLYFMDNALSFGTSWEGHHRAIIYLKRAQKFSRRLIDRLRHLQESEVRAVLAVDRGPYELLLDDDEIRALMRRRDYAMKYIDELIEERGEDAVLVFP